MANPEHLAKLHEGVKAWNEWRLNNSGIEIDLSQVNLNGMNLSKSNLARADLSESILNEVDFSNAHLFKANLSKSKLFFSCLCEADLSEANLSEAKFWNANLSGANLFRANLSEALLSGADLNNTLIGFTIFGAVDLSEVKNLEKVRHHTSSSIGIDTLYCSKGHIPDVFLRGCGVPDKMIEYACSLTTRPIQYYSCFISYSHKDDEFAKRLHADLDTKKVLCWFAPHDLPIGAKTRPSIDEAIRVHDKLLLILSEHSVQSNWVEHEAEHALDLETEREKLVLFPVRLDDAVMESKAGWAANVKRQRNIGDFTRWKDHDAYKVSFDRLLRDLKAGK
jgi:hypothetical protein